MLKLKGTEKPIYEENFHWGDFFERLHILALLIS